MAFIPAIDTARCEIRYTCVGQRVENTLWFQHDTGVITEADREALGAYLEGWYNSEIKPLQSASVIYQEVYVVDWSAENAGTSTVNSLAGTTGAGVSPISPNNVTMAVSFRTALRGRSSRGRNYIIGLMESDVTGSIIEATTRSNWRNAYDAILVDPPTDFTWSVASFYTDNVARVTALVQPINGVVVVDDYVDSQRRRLPGRGN